MCVGVGKNNHRMMCIRDVHILKGNNIITKFTRILIIIIELKINLQYLIFKNL